MRRAQASTRTTVHGEQLVLEHRGERDGMQVYGTRQRVPFKGLPMAALAEAPVPAARVEDDATATERDDGFTALLEATASSTGKDSHGTEMTERALASMAEQMKGGIPYLPSHCESEWYEVIGRTVDAEIVDGRVAVDGATGKPGDGKVLRVIVGLYPDEPKAEKLVRVVRQADRAVGTSIGGWFTDIEFLVNNEDEVERVLIHDVELDHLATTRRPSNRESWIDGLVERAQQGLCAVRAEVPALETRTEPEVVEPEPEPAVRESPETVSPPEHGALDTGDAASSTAVEPDAVQRAVPADTPTSHGAAVMDDTTDTTVTPTTDERLDALARSQEAMNGHLGSLVALLTEQAARTAAPPAPAPVVETPAPVQATDTERAELERQNAELRARLDRTMTAAGRTGMAALANQRIVERAGGFKGMVARAAKALPDTSALRMVCEAQVERRDAARKNTPDRESLEADLRSLLAGAYADGIITDPNERGVWQ